MPFRSAQGCCARCGRVISCHAKTSEGAVGSRPYRHKPRREPGTEWCDGHLYPALHYEESPDRRRVEMIHMAERQHAEMMARRRQREKG